MIIMSNVEIIDKPVKSDKLKRVCAYVRVSTKDSHQDSSYDIQIEAYTNMILNKKDWKFTGIFADEGKTGTTTKQRIEFNKMIQLAKVGGIDMIITKSISRFARNTIDCLSVIKELKGYNVEVFFEKENISSFDPKIEFVISVLAGMAQEESRSISENVIWRQRRDFQNGKVPMVTSKFLGYTRDSRGNIKIVDNEARLVRKIYDLYTSGYSINKIVEYLNKKGYTTKANNKPYYHGAVLNILNNEKYTGNAILQKTKRAYVGDKNGIKNQTSLPKYFVENSHPAIISQEQFQEVHKIKNEKILKYNKTLDKKILSFKAKQRSIYNEFVQCGNCGKYFHSKLNHPGKPYEKHILMCRSNKQKKTCSAEILFADTINEVILSHINYIIQNKNDFLTNLRSHLESSREIKTIKARMLEIETTLKSSDIKKLSIYKEQVSSLNIERTALENDLRTTYNIDLIIQTYDALLRKHKTKLLSLTNFPFKQLITRVIIRNRDNILLVINPFKQKFTSTSFTYNTLHYEYLIRKTLHNCISKIDIVS